MPRTFSEESMMGPFYRFRDREHLKLLLDATIESGILIVEEAGASPPDTYVFKEGPGEIHGSVGTRECESMIYFGFGHSFNSLRWFSDGALLKKIEAIYQSQGSK